MKSLFALKFLAKAAHVPASHVCKAIGLSHGYAATMTSGEGQKSIPADRLADAAKAVRWELRLVNPVTNEYVTIDGRCDPDPIVPKDDLGACLSGIDPDELIG